MRKTLRTSAALALISMLVSFQNCAPASFNMDAVSGESLKASNGSVFDGKPTFYQTLPHYECEGNAAPRSFIQLDSDQAYLSLNQNDHCGALTQQPIDAKEIDRSSFDADFIGYRDGIYERSAQTPDLASTVYNEAWCQSNPDSPSAVDVAIRFDEQTLQATSQIYFENKGQSRSVPAFQVSRLMTDNEADYSAPSFSLVIDRSQPAPEKWWYYSATLKANLETGPWSGTVRCRMQAGKLLGSVQKIYAKNGDWNSYVQRTDATGDLFHQADVSCSAVTRWSDCFHGGDKLMVRTESKKCADLQITDSLQAFSWQCEDQPEGAVFHSLQLNPGKGLSDLVTTSGWKNNFIQIKENQHVIYESISMPWWKNAVLPLPANPTGPSISLNQAGAVYVSNTSSVSSGYSIDQKQISLVIQPGATLSGASSMADNCNANGFFSSSPSGYPAPSKCLVTASGTHFIWIEGDFNGKNTNATANLNLTNSYFVRLHRIQTHDNSGYGIYQSSVRGSIYDDLSVDGNQYGLMSTTSEGNLFGQLSFQNNTVTGLLFTAWDNDNTLYDITAVHNGIYGLEFKSTLNLKLISARASDHTNSGISVEGFTDNALFDSVFSTQNNFGLDISRASSANQYGNRFYNMALVGNQTGLRIMKESGPTAPNKESFAEDFRLGNTADCSVYVIGTGAYQASVCPGTTALGSEVYGSTSVNLKPGCTVSKDGTTVVCSGQPWSETCRLPDSGPLILKGAMTGRLCSNGL